MKISAVQHEVDEAGIAQRQTITIEVEPGDDETGFLTGLVWGGTLEAFLRVYASRDTATLADDPDLWHLMVRFAKVANRAEGKLSALMAAARAADPDTWSWRKLERATEITQATIRRRVRAVEAPDDDITE